MMKLTELILLLHTMMLEHGNLTVYQVNDLEGKVEAPNPHVSEGGSMPYPYPGVYLN